MGERRRLISRGSHERHAQAGRNTRPGCSKAKRQVCLQQGWGRTAMPPNYLALETFIPPAPLILLILVAAANPIPIPRQHAERCQRAAEIPHPAGLAGVNHIGQV